MIRNFAREQLTRLSVKMLDQVFVMQAKEGLGCSQFEAEALTNLIKEVAFPGSPSRKGSRQVSWS